MRRAFFAVFFIVRVGARMGVAAAGDGERGAELDSATARVQITQVGQTVQPSQTHSTAVS
jgi:hypothetical protein